MGPFTPKWGLLPKATSPPLSLPLIAHHVFRCFARDAFFQLRSHGRILQGSWHPAPRRRSGTSPSSVMGWGCGRGSNRAGWLWPKCHCQSSPQRPMFRSQLLVDTGSCCCVSVSFALFCFNLSTSFMCLNPSWALWRFNCLLRSVWEYFWKSGPWPLKKIFDYKLTPDWRMRCLGVFFFYLFPGVYLSIRIFGIC